MVESKFSIFDGDSVAPPPSYEEVRAQDVIVVEAEPQEMSNLIEKESQQQGNPASEADKDREHIVVAGVGSALLGMMICGPIFAVILGCGAAYAAETNPKVRDRVGRAWAKTQKFNEEHRVVQRGVNSIGKGVYWIVEKISGSRNDNSNENVDSSPPTKPTVY